MEETIKKGGFSWLGFFFGPAYFSGYDKLRVGLVMAILSGIPVLGFGVMGYAGFEAKKKLPIKQQPFKWGLALFAIVIQIISAAGFTSAITSLQNAGSQAMLEEVSGVWKGQGSMVTIDLASTKPSIEVNGSAFPVEIDQVDEDNLVVTVSAQVQGQTLQWSLKQLYDDQGKSFHLNFFLHDGTSEELTFIRNL